MVKTEARVSFPPSSAFQHESPNQLADRKGIAPSYMTHVPRLTLLAPDIVESILNGTQGWEVTLARVLVLFPAEWGAQFPLGSQRFSIRQTIVKAGSKTFPTS
jgi:hypothetical protein